MSQMLFANKLQQQFTSLRRHLACDRPRHGSRRTPVFASVTEQPAAQQAPSDIGDLARKMLTDDPEAAEQLQRYQAAVLRVEKAKAAAQALEDNYKEAVRTAMAADEADGKSAAQRSADTLAAAEVSAAELRMLAAELQLSLVEKQQREVSLAAQRDADRVESAKAGAAAAVGALLGYLPLAAVTPSTSSSPISGVLAAAAVVASGLLFGVTYRYAIREDADNSHLKGGVVAAFGLVRAAAAADILQAASSSDPFSLELVVGPAALYAAQSMLLFGFAATSVEAAFRSGLLKRFPGAPSN